MKLSRRTLLRSGAAAVIAPTVGSIALDSVARAAEGESTVAEEAAYPGTQAAGAGSLRSAASGGQLREKR